MNYTTIYRANKGVTVEVAPMILRREVPVQYGVDLHCKICGASLIIVALGELRECIEVAMFVAGLLDANMVTEDVHWCEPLVISNETILHFRRPERGD